MRKYFLIILLVLLPLHASCMVNESGPSFEPSQPGVGWDYGEKLNLNTRFVASPVLVENRIFLASLDGNLYVFNAEQGKKDFIPGNNKKIFVNQQGKRVFINDRGKEEEPRPSMYRVTQGIRSTPVYREGILYFGAFDKKIHGVDIVTGQERFTFATNGYISASPVIEGDMLYIGSYDCQLRAIDLSTNRLKWQFDSKNQIPAAPALTDSGGIIFADQKGKVTHLEKETGKVIWQIEVNSNTYSSPVYADGIVVVASRDGHVRAFHSANGALYWDFKSEPNGFKYKEEFWTTPATGDYIDTDLSQKKALYIGSTWGRLYALKLHPGNSKGQLLWDPFEITTAAQKEVRVSNAILSDAAVLGDKVFFGANDAIFYCLDRNTGEKLWSFTTIGEIRCRPLFINDQVIFASNDHYLYGLNIKDGLPIRGQGQQ